MRWKGWSGGLALIAVALCASTTQAQEDEGLPGVPRVPGQGRDARSPADLRPGPRTSTMTGELRGTVVDPPSGARGELRGTVVDASPSGTSRRRAGTFIGLRGIVTDPTAARGRSAGDDAIRDAWPDWTAAQTADALRAATAGWGTDTAALFEALASLDPAERERLRRQHPDAVAATFDDLSDVLGERSLAEAMLKAPGTILSQAALERQVDAALKKRRVTDSSRRRDLVGLTRHLANYADDLTAGEVAPFRTGNEYALRQAIARSGQPLTPGEVLHEALRLERGDAYRALLTAHNTIRALARGADSALNAQVPAARRRDDWFGRIPDHAFMQAHLQPIRGGTGDEPGTWYHLFGTALMSFAGGSTLTRAMVHVEEKVVSHDAWQDPLEPYVDRLGVSLGQMLRARVE